MASLKKRGNKYAVIYDFIDENGMRKQRWESFSSHAEAERRKIEVEKDKIDGTFVVPNASIVSDFFITYVDLYGEKKWSLSTYTRNMRLIRNYINPIFGKMKLQEITPMVIEKYYAKLKETPVKPVNQHIEERKVSTGTIKQIHKLLHCAFGVAVKWQLLYSNPFERIDPPKHIYKKREIWTAEMIASALEACEDPKLAISIHLAFAESLRIGEVMGLQWKNVHMSDDDLDKNDAYIEIKSELATVSREAMEKLKQKDITFVFPSEKMTKTMTVLKKPKTDSSIRKIWLPKTLARILRKWQEEQQRFKDYYADEYIDYDLVVCNENGYPCSRSTIRKGFQMVTEKAGLPPVVFHSLRHSSTTYKLKLNNGDIKATQGDTGHAQADMVTDVYSHILDEDRKVNAQKFDDAFYKVDNSGNTQSEQKSNIDLDSLVKELQNDPQMLKELIDALKC